MSRSCRMIAWMSSTAIGSIPANGSSRRMKLGLIASARAISSRRRSPPESWFPFERRTAKRSKSPTNWLIRRRCSARPRPSVFEHRAQVAFNGQPTKHRRFLRQVTDALLRPQVHGKVGDVHVVEEDTASVRPGQTHDHVERGRLAGAIWSEQTHDFALADLDRHVLDDWSPPIDLSHILGADAMARGRPLGHGWPAPAAALPDGPIS